MGIRNKYFFGFFTIMFLILRRYGDACFWRWGISCRFVKYLKEILVIVEATATRLKTIIMKCVLFYCFSRVAVGSTTNKLCADRWRSSAWNSSASAATTGKCCWISSTSSPLFRPSTLWRRTTLKFLAGLTNLKVEYRCFINVIYGTTWGSDPETWIGWLFELLMLNAESGMNKHCSKLFVCLFFSLKILNSLRSRDGHTCWLEKVWCHDFG